MRSAHQIAQYRRLIAGKSTAYLQKVIADAHVYNPEDVALVEDELRLRRITSIAVYWFVLLAFAAWATYGVFNDFFGVE